MFNKVILIGNLTRDIELRYTPDGLAVAKVGLATNRVYTDSTTKEKRQEVMFIDITIFGRAAEVANQYIRKGSQVLVEGRLTFNQWVDQTGQKRSKHEIIADSVKFLGSKEQSTPQNQTATQSQQDHIPQQPQMAQPQSNIPSIDVDEEDIPF